MSSTGTTEDDVSERWLEFDDNLSVPTQTLDEILAEPDNGFEDEFSPFEEDDSPSPEKPIGGKPTAIAVSASLIAVGTVRGLVALFDRKSGRIVQFMHDKKDKCPISAMCFSPNGGKIAVGYSRGSLRVYRTTADKLVDERAEAVQPGHGILHLVYISSSTLLLTDSAGNAFEYREGRSSGSRCIFTGCKGEAVNVHFVPSEQLVLLSTLRQVLLFNTSTGKIRGQLRLSRTARRPAAPRLAVATETRFCLARGQTVSVYQAQTNARGQLICPLVRVIELGDRNENSVQLNQLLWLDDHHLLLLDTRENLTLVDVHRGLAIGSLPIGDVRLVYGSADFKGFIQPTKAPTILICLQGLSTGGQVSEALRCLAANVCFQSACHRDGEAFFLGQSGVFVVHVADQLDQLERFRHIYVLIRACVMTSNFKHLYELVYRRLEADPLSKTAFMELLEEFVVEGQLFDPPPALIRDYLAYLSAEGQMSLFETAVTRMPIASNQLFDGIIYVMNHALGDYIGPLEEMCENLAGFVHKSVALGSKVLLYLSCCLAGRAYPFGSLPAELADVVAIESYRFMVALKSKKPDEDEKYPRLRLFLRFDAQQFLNVICTCADAPLFSGSDGRLKRFVDILVALSEDQGAELSTLLLSFLAHLLHKAAIFQDDQQIEELILRTMERTAADGSEMSSRRARTQMEHAAIELMRAAVDLPLDSILQKARQLSFVLICAYVYTTRKQYVNLLLCCMEDPNNPAFVFDVIGDLFGGIGGQELEDVRRFVRDSMIRLNKIDTLKTAHLFLEHFIEVIATAPHLPFDLLRNCFMIRRKQGARTICGDEEADDLLFRSFFEAAINRGHLAADEFAERLSTEQLDAELAELLDYWMPMGARDDVCQRCRPRPTAGVPHRRIRFFLQLTSKFQQETREGGWLLRLFHLLLENQDSGKQIATFDAIFSDLLSAIVESGVGVEKVVEAMFSHQSFCDAPYSTFSALIKKILLSCEMDELMLESTSTKSPHCSVVESDLCVFCSDKLVQSFLVFR
ncbi:hypothetical protein M3Y99_00779100 [Aphelenchoides fujianensis]|nr:hypothetical protein M3Y99_00779100 [Aphelenchoides fujianensis]